MNLVAPDGGEGVAQSIEQMLQRAFLCSVTMFDLTHYNLEDTHETCDT